MTWRLHFWGESTRVLIPFDSCTRKITFYGPIKRPRTICVEVLIVSELLSFLLSTRTLHRLFGVPIFELHCFIWFQFYFYRFFFFFYCKCHSSVFWIFVKFFVKLSAKKTTLSYLENFTVSGYRMRNKRKEQLWNLRFLFSSNLFSSF